MLQMGVVVACPYCGESITLQVDPLAGAQEYIEDCHVCCSPMLVNAGVDEEGAPWAQVERSDG